MGAIKSVRGRLLICFYIEVFTSGDEENVNGKWGVSR